MSTIDYSQFETNTGYWNGSNQFYALYKDYSPIVSYITDLDKSNPIIHFSFTLNGDDNDGLILDASGKLKIILMDQLNLPFDRAYVDFGSYPDYVAIKNNSGVWQQDGNPNGFILAYTSGGFWAIGPKNYESPGIMFVADATSGTNILDLAWIPLSYSYIDSIGFDMTPISNIKARCHIDYIPSGFDGIRFDNNNYSWNKRSIYFETVPSELTISGLNSNSIVKSITFTGGVDMQDLGHVSFYWSGDNLYKGPQQEVKAPLPFDSAQIFATEMMDTIAIYPDEPMIHYTVIDDHTIQLDTSAEDVAALIPPLRKLYVNFSGITP